MKLETIKTDCNEIYVEAEDFTVTVNTWSNHEGASIMVHGKGNALRLAGAFRWEEIDVLLAAFAAARAGI